MDTVVEINNTHKRTIRRKVVDALRGIDVPRGMTMQLLGLPSDLDSVDICVNFAFEVAHALGRLAPVRELHENAKLNTS